MNVQPKIAIIHDAFLYRGGGERLVTLMAKSLGADIISGFFSEGSFDPHELGFEGNMIALGRPVFTKGIRHMVLKWRFFWKARILREYDIVIFSGDCLGAMRHVRPDAQTVYYCHTPPRYLYDFREQYLARYPRGIREIMELGFTLFASLYEKHLREFDRIFTNSENVHERLLFFCGVESQVLYPPTDTSRFGTKILSDTVFPFPKKEYFLSFARLSPPKRVDVIVDAFLDTPEQNLILTYGKNDPLKDAILEKIKNAPNILALESPNDAELIGLIQ
jgi:glycosyltransferase involved in cell wall biosynthesis